jgi:ABC-type sugar transport system ATPase subunit
MGAVMPASLELVNLTKQYSAHSQPLRGVSLSIAAGERVVLLGATGSGKSTLLRCIAGLESPDSGRIVLNGQDITGWPPERRCLGYLPQRVALYPHLTVAQHWQLSHKTRPLPEAWHALANRYPHQLSGGQRQELAAARAAHSDLELLDEPLTGLDPGRRLDFRQRFVLSKFHSQATILLVTHDPADAVAIGQRVAVLVNGALEQVGSPTELLAAPNTLSIAKVLGHMVLLPGRIQAEVSSGHGDSTAVQPTPMWVLDRGSARVGLPAAVRMALERQPLQTAELTLGLRPHDVSLKPAGSSAPKTDPWLVVLTEPAGSGWYLTVAQGQTCVRSEWPEATPPALGTQLEWTLKPGCGTWFMSHTGQRVAPETASSSAII